MRSKREIIEEFTDLVNAEVADTIEQNISYNVFEKVKKILVLQSAPVQIVEELLQNICKVNLDAEFIVIGEDACENLHEKFPDRNIIFVSHNKVFADDDIEMIKQIISEQAINVAVFFNNFVNSVDFSSVEHILAFIDERVSVYSYSYIQKELNKHKDVPGHIYGCIVYKDLVEWFKQFH